MGLVLALAVAAPAAAAPPERFEDPIFIIFPDVEYGLVVFWNITRDDFCAWAADDFEGDPPVVQSVPLLFNETGSGSVKITWTATRHLELWALDEGAELTGPCEDTDDSTAPWAIGSARATYTDNDLFVSGTRTNSFGDRGQGTVMAGDGSTWHYSWVFRALIDRDDEFRAVVPDRTTLVQRR